LTTEVEQRRGSATHPLSYEEVELKFRRLAAAALRDRDIEELIGVIGTIEQAPNLGRLSRLIAMQAA